jgi:hypothetical protein
MLQGWLASSGPESTPRNTEDGSATLDPFPGGLLSSAQDEEFHQTGPENFGIGPYDTEHRMVYSMKSSSL